MSNTRIRALLDQLREELRSTDIDAQTQTLMRELDSDIHRLAEVDHPATASDSMLEQARRLEGKFAANHPNAERIVAEVISTLSKMGI